MTPDEMQGKLTYSRERLDAAHEAMARALALSESAHDMGGGIPGFGGSGNQRAAAQVRGAHNRAHKAWQEAHERIDKWSYRVKSLERRIAEAERKTFTLDDIAGAGFVHDGTSWRKVVRVNKVSVSVESGYSWVDKIPFKNIHAVQMPLEGTEEGSSA